MFTLHEIRCNKYTAYYTVQFYHDNILILLLLINTVIINTIILLL